MPKTMPVTSVRTKVNDRMRQSGSARISSGVSSDGISPSSPRVIQRASRRPRAPPAIESIRLSIRSCRISCPREAPSDSRTAISRWRAKARAISRFATLAQAISSTSPTMHISTSSGGGEVVPERRVADRGRLDAHLALAGTARARMPTSSLRSRSVISYCRICVNRPCSGACADSAVWPGLSRAKTCTQRVRRSAHLEPVPLRHDHGLHQQGHAQVRGAWAGSMPGETRCRHPHDRHRVVVDEDFLADHRRVARKSPLPVVVAEHDHRVAAVDLVVLLGVEDAPGRRPHARACVK